MAENYLTFDRVTKNFGMVPVVLGASLAIARNSLVVFLGPSGCGKTTLMRMVGGLDTPTSGTIRLEGRVIDRPGRRRGMVFQSYSSFPWLTVEPDGTRARRIESADHAHEGRLAASRWAEKHHKRTARHGECRIEHDGNRAERLGDAIECQIIAGHRSPLKDT